MAYGRPALSSKLRLNHTDLTWTVQTFTQTGRNFTFTFNIAAYPPSLTLSPFCTNMSPSARAISDLAVELCNIIIAGRGLPAGANSVHLAHKAGRIVTQSMKMAINLTVIPPVLLSCAMALRSCAENVNGNLKIVRDPDWGAIGYDDNQIMKHPQHEKALVWMDSIGIAKDVQTVKVSENGIDWEAILSDRAKQQEVLEQRGDGAGTITSHQKMMSEAVGGTSHIRTFGPARRNAAGKGKEGKQEKGDAESRMGSYEGIVTKNTQQHWSDETERKRRRTSHTSADNAENLDVDMQIDELIEGPPHKASGTTEISGQSTATEAPQGNNQYEAQVTEVARYRCTPCNERNLECIVGYSQKTGKKRNSCEECTAKKRRCHHGREPEIVVRVPGSATSLSKSR
ncbi:hypothetical protein BDR06DRAFT_978060, partial [Suillus hirtellus]